MVTSWDILFFWVARMMMMGMKFMGEGSFQRNLSAFAWWRIKTGRR
jgi:valyl-tRNA synthetase